MGPTRLGVVATASRTQEAEKEIQPDQEGSLTLSIRAPALRTNCENYATFSLRSASTSN